MKPTALARIAAYIVDSRQDVTAGDTRNAALRCLFDVIVAAAAGRDDRGPAAVRHVMGMFGEGSIPAWFTASRGSEIAAAWANSAAASAQDLDDGHRLARGHPGAVVIPAVLAVGQARRASWDRVLTAIVIGYEVGITIAAARRSYGNTGTWGSYAVVAAAGSLLDTPASVLEQALAIAGETAPNQLFASAPPPRDPAPEGSHVKEGIPWSVVTGLSALRLAEAGHTGPRNILESTRHYDLPNPMMLGEKPHIRRVYHKLYACCRHIHAPLDALLGLMKKHDLRDAESIRVETTSGALRISNLTQPRNLIDMQYSIPYCLANALRNGPAGMVRLDEGAVGDPVVEALAERVSLVLEPAFDARFPAETLARVTVRCQGRDIVSPITSPRGDWSDPLTWGDLRDKAMAVAAALDDPALAVTLESLADGLSQDGLPDLQDVLACRLRQTADHP